MRTALLAIALVACGKEKPSTAPPPPPAPERFGKVKQPPVSPVCAKARSSFGYGAECLETELPELTTPAGKLVRVVRKGDATARWLYVLVRPDGTMTLGDGGINGSILDEVTAALDLEATPPEKLALLDATLGTEAALVRCLPGTNDALPPDKEGKAQPCAAPAVAKEGDKRVLSYVIEQFPHPRLLNRDQHWLYATRVEVRAHELSGIEGTGLVELPRDAPLPPSMPPVPTMTTPPAWVAAPVAAPADVGAALCAEAAKKLSGIEGRQCRAYGYPSLDLPTGSLYYLANDAGQDPLLALRKPDGGIALGFALGAEDNPLKAVIAAYDPAVVPPAKLVAAHLFLQGEPARILCLPGSGDVIPGHECKPPAAAKQGDAVRLSAILEELPFPDGHGMVSDPAVRATTWELRATGGFEGNGMRLIDMRE